MTKSSPHTHTLPVLLLFSRTAACRLFLLLFVVTARRGGMKMGMGDDLDLDPKLG